MPSLRNRLATAGLVVGLALVAHAADAQGPVSWSLKKGETLKYAFSQTNDIKVVVNGQQASNKSELNVDLTWMVKSVAADGSAELTQTVDRARADITANGMVIKYDSKEKAGTDPGSQALAKVYDAVVGKPYTFTLTPSGEVKDVKVPEAVSAAIVGSPFQNLADSGSFLSGKGVENMMAQVLPRLDPKATAKGATWTGSLKLPTAPLTMNLSTTYTLDDVTPSAKISSAIKTEIAVDDGANVKVDITKQSGNGAFTLSGGHLTDSKLNQAFDMTIKAANAEISQTITIASTLKLVP